jgi:predicted ArsR family transcriptional regulator
MKQTQTEMVYDMLLANRGGITAMDVQDELGVMRLAARVYDLRSGGHNIVTETVRVRGRYGWAHVAKYRLVK